MIRNRSLLIAIVVVVVFVVGLVIGMLLPPGEWYAGLDKPSFNPPNWLFGPVWSVLYIMIGIAGGRTLFDRPASTSARLWLAQMGLNWLWSPVFFGLHSLGWALVVILAMLAAIVGFIVTSWRSDRVSALLFLPYLGWVSFATLLNASLLFLNP